ncbi:MAG TPA: hypothetical protein VF740_09170 [Candidatus Acidoferrum sp.]
MDHRFNSRHPLWVSYTRQSNIGLNDQPGQLNDLNFSTSHQIISHATLNSMFRAGIVVELCSSWKPREAESTDSKKFLIRQ